MAANDGETSQARALLSSQALIELPASSSTGIIRKNAPSYLDLTAVTSSNTHSNIAHSYSKDKVTPAAQFIFDQGNALPSGTQGRALTSPSDSSTLGDSSFPNTPLDALPQFIASSNPNAAQIRSKNPSLLAAQYIGQTFRPTFNSMPPYPGYLPDPTPKQGTKLFLQHYPKWFRFY